MIQNTDIKLMASEQLNDSDTGGGSMTAYEVVDGVVNNLFSDISRLDRTHGRLSLRKTFLSVQTETTDEFLGAHAIISQRAADPAVSVTMFSSASMADQRTQAQSRMENYVAKGGRTSFELYGDHLIGARTLRVHTTAAAANDLSRKPPNIDDVLVLYSASAGKTQFVKISRVSDRQVQQFTVAAGAGVRTFYRQIITCDITAPLANDHAANDVTDLVIGSPLTAIHDTTPGSSAVYYGCMPVSGALSIGDSGLSVANIFSQIVPTADTSSSFYDAAPWAAGDPVRTFAYAVTTESRRLSWSVTAGYPLVSDGTTFVDYLVFGKWVRLTDNGAGILSGGETSDGSGTIDYLTGNISVSLGALPDVGSQVIFTWRTDDYAAVGQNVRFFNFFEGNYEVTLGANIFPGSITVKRDGVEVYYSDDAEGNLKSGSTTVGSINYVTGLITWTEGGDHDGFRAIWQTIAAEPRLYTFRIDGSPLAPSSVQIDWPTYSGSAILLSQNDGTFSGGGVAKPTGTIDYLTGIVELTTGTADYLAMTPIRISGTSIRGVALDENLIGIDPVRMPSDGRVQLVTPGQSVVIHHTEDTTLPADLTSGQVVTLPRTGINWVEVWDAEGTRVPEDRFIFNGAAGTITWDNPIDIAEFFQPLIARHRIEEMRLVTDVQFTGQLGFARPLARAFPVGTQLSTILEFGDLKARVSALFRQSTWTSVWSDTVIGSTPSGSYNDAIYPLVLTNKGALPQRWALVFTSSSAFNVLSEELGIIGTGTTAAPCSPLNPATGAPYFTIAAAGWSAGWATGNVLRFNTTGTVVPLWLVRTTQIDPEGFGADDFRLELRGDAQ